MPDKGNFDVRQEITDSLSLKKEQWGLVYNSRDRDAADSLYATLQKAGQTYGIFFEEPIYYEIKTSNVKDWIKVLDDDFTKNDTPSFIVSVAAPQARGVYQGLKRFLYNDVGLEH